MKREALTGSRRLVRLVDASANRTMEALRVLEDVSRFLLNDPKTLRVLRSLRHRVPKILERSGLGPEIRFEERNISEDFGKEPHAWEGSRPSIRDLVLANTQRAKESLRALEESLKLLDGTGWKSFKQIRFELYDLEPKILKRVQTLRDR